MQRTTNIVGGSLGGLLSGIVYSRHGYKVRILERTETMEDQGAGIVCGGDLLEFMQRFDNTHTKIDVESKARQYLYKDGNVMDTEYRSQNMTSWTTVYEVLKRNFSSQGGEYISGIKVDDFKVNADKITLHAGSEKYDSDILICADGASSFCRSRYEPDVKRVYAGYIAFRGIVPEASLSEASSKSLVGNFTFFHASGTQMLAYLIPGPKGTLDKGKRFMNWVWYNNYPDDSEEYNEVMTDKNGIQHPYSVGHGNVAPVVLEKIGKRAVQVLPPQFAELYQKTKEPFLQVITDARSNNAVYEDGKVIMVGDSVCGPRPHTAASTNQAALHALLLDEVLKGKSTLSEYNSHAKQYAIHLDRAGRQMGDRSQFGHHPLGDDQ